MLLHASSFYSLTVEGRSWGLFGGTSSGKPAGRLGSASAKPKRRGAPQLQRSARRSEQASIFEACAETKGKLQLPVFLKLLHGDRDVAESDALHSCPVAAGALGGSPRPRGASLRCPGRRCIAEPVPAFFALLFFFVLLPGDPGDPRSVAGTSSEAPRGGPEACGDLKHTFAKVSPATLKERFVAQAGRVLILTRDIYS